MMTEKIPPEIKRELRKLKHYVSNAEGSLFYDFSQYKRYFNDPAKLKGIRYEDLGVINGEYVLERTFFDEKNATQIKYAVYTLMKEHGTEAKGFIYRITPNSTIIRLCSN
jgi:hypothetical protein